MTTTKIIGPIDNDSNENDFIVSICRSLDYLSKVAKEQGEHMLALRLQEEKKRLLRNSSTTEFVDAGSTRKCSNS